MASRRIIGATALFGVLFAIGGIAYAQNAEPIKARQAILGGWGDAGKPIGPMLRGQQPFDLAATQKFLNLIVDGSKKLPDLFPDDSKVGEKTEALPVIWDDKPKFLAGYTKIGADAAAALAAIKDEASFKAEMPKVASNCGGCHKMYRKPS